MTNLKRFINESNGIEGICREATEAEIHETTRFLDLSWVTLEDLIKFVRVFEPEARLRSKASDIVTVGNYMPPIGGPAVGYSLMELLSQIDQRLISPYQSHVAYEMLHPFTDCNGRSGRMLWLWAMQHVNGALPTRDFLHEFYYQTFQHCQQPQPTVGVKDGGSTTRA